MSDLTPERLDQIEECAMAATPGPWRWMKPGIDYYEVLNDSTTVAVDMLVQPDAEHIANMDPATTLALIATVRAARELHAPIWVESICWDKPRSGCDRDDCYRTNHALSPYRHKYGTQICQECSCDEDASHYVEHPCHTIQTLGGPS